MLRNLVLLLALVTQSAIAAPVFGYRVVARLPHSTSSFTEGFFFLDGRFYEGTGLERHSAVLVTDPESGRLLQSTSIAPDLFGEGIVDFGPLLYEWTWKAGLCFVYDRATLHLVRTLHYTGEGWGMTRTDRQLITSDGTPNLTFRDPATFAPVRTITVHDGPALVEQLNELEFIHSEIYANIWHSDRIARISPTDGHVIAWIDLTGLLPAPEHVSPEAVLNGIAYDAKHHRLFVTGKQWPAIFEIHQIPPRLATGEASRP